MLTYIKHTIILAALMTATTGTSLAAEWNLPLTVSSGATRTGVVIGIANQATNGYDTGYDSQNPFTDELLNAYFSHPEWNLVKSGKPVSSFYRDVRGSIPQDFILTVKTSLTPVTISWERNIIPVTINATISDGYNTSDMQKVTTFSYSPGGETSNLTIRVAPGDTTPPAIPAGLAFSATGNSINISWAENTEPDLAGYRLHFLDDQGGITRTLDVKKVTNYNLLNVPVDVPYNVAVSAYDTTGNQSGLSSTIIAVRRPPPPPPVNGTCGSSNGGTFTIAPTSNLCATGTTSAVTGSGPWNWSCAGTNGGTTASCSARLAALPVVTSFQIPALNNSRTISVIDLKATAGMGVAGYLITENSTVPSAANTSWSVAAPSSYTTTTATVTTLYAWARDNGGNVSASKSATMKIDTTIPAVTAFAIPAASNTLYIPVSKLTATDNNVTIAGYKLTESGTAPLPQDSGWSIAKPAGYTFDSVGVKTLYAWVKDGAGNISLAKSAKVTIDMTEPTVTAFTLLPPSKGPKVTVKAYSATDNIAVTGYMITESATVPLKTASAWKSTPLTSYTASGSGTITIYGWAKDAAGNISSAATATVTIKR